MAYTLGEWKKKRHEISKNNQNRIKANPQQQQE